MTRNLKLPFVVLVGIAFGIALIAPAAFAQRAPYRVLVFSKTAGYRHESIPAGIQAIRELGRQNDFTVEATEDASVFTDARLSMFNTVVFLNTAGNVLDEAQQDALQRYVEQGGGWAGVHGAAATEYEWPWYGELAGGYFATHPAVQEATVLVVDQVFPASKHLPDRWERRDEWYNFRANPRGNVHVLMTLDEKTYEGGEMGFDHPIAWAHEVGKGRAFYTGLGHTIESYSDPLFTQHLLGAIQWTAGVVPGDAGATLSSNFEKVVLEENVSIPMELSVAKDGRVFWVERDGTVGAWDPETGTSHTAGAIPSAIVIEDGLSGIALDPNFTENGWLYVYYAPADLGPNRVSRFTYRGDSLDLASEKVLLTVPVQREYCCHSAGSMTFGPDGTLYISTGDNTQPSDRGGSQADERPGHELADAQRTAGNTNDLRGKVLRIKPMPDGTAVIPEGNLFEPDSLHRGEIYTMGFRNPYRISFDPETGWLYSSEISATHAPTPERGPWGWEEINQARGPGFYGWPYFGGPNEPYREYDYATQTSGNYYNVERPENDSPNNTGARFLPPAQPAFIWYTYSGVEPFLELGAGGMTAAAGPVYRRPATAEPNALPAYYEGTLFIYEWMRNWIMEVKLDDQGNLLKISPFLPDMEFVRPHDMEVGPDGALYIIEWGDEFWGSNENARIVRLDYTGRERAPEAVADASVTSGAAPLTVHFSAAESEARNGSDALTYAWDFNGDGSADASTRNATFTFSRGGSHTARLTVTDSDGRTSTTEVAVVVGNTAPAVSIAWPPNGGFFAWDEPVPYQVTVVDPEDGTISAQDVSLEVQAGHDKHTHQGRTVAGQQGTFEMARNAHVHYPDMPLMDRFITLEAQYTDQGANGVRALSDSTTITLNPKRMDAEHYSRVEGASRAVIGLHPAAKGFVETAIIAMDVSGGSHLAYAPVNLANIESLTFRFKPVASGSIEVRLDSPTGALLAQAAVDSAGANLTPIVHELLDDFQQLDHGLEPPAVDESVYKGWYELTVPVRDPGGTHTLYFVFTSESDGALMQLDWIRFNGPGVNRAGASQ